MENFLVITINHFQRRFEWHYKFFRLQVEEFLPAYMDAFDIVLVDDQTMNVTRAILKYIFNKP